MVPVLFMFNIVHLIIVIRDYYTVSKTDLYLCSNTSSPYNGYIQRVQRVHVLIVQATLIGVHLVPVIKKKLTKQCICTSASNGTCSTTKTEYRCAAGYYGTSTNGTSGYSPCSNTGSARKQYGSGTNIYPTSDAGVTMPQLTNAITQPVLIKILPEHIQLVQNVITNNIISFTKKKSRQKVGFLTYIHIQRLT